MVDTLGVGQDSVVFLGRRSFRMELVERPAEDALGIPRRGAEISTEKIFDRDRGRAAGALPTSSPSVGGIANATSIFLCSATFFLGIALTLLFSRPPGPRRVAAAVPPAPAVGVVGEPIPDARPIVVSLPPPPELPPARRPLARPARAVRPRPVRAPHSEPPAPAPWVDPFAE